MRGGYRVAERRGRKGLTLLQAYSLLVTNKDDRYLRDQRRGGEVYSEEGKEKKGIIIIIHRINDIYIA